MAARRRVAQTLLTVNINAHTATLLGERRGEHTATLLGERRGERGQTTTGSRRREARAQRRAQDHAARRTRRGGVVAPSHLADRSRSPALGGLCAKPANTRSSRQTRAGLSAPGSSLALMMP